jgi:hypothetical protein
MHKRHQKILDGIFQKPDRRDIQWEDFITLMSALGADIMERGGSMVGLRLNGRYAVFHRPHPGNEIYLSDLKRIRRFLNEAGVTREE